MTESIVISRLAKDGPTKTAELAQLEGRPQSMRATVSALDKMGIVERKAHPTDGRQVLIALTRHGVERNEAEKALAPTVAELEHCAQHDPMTNLPNRVRLMDRLSQP